MWGRSAGPMPIPVSAMLTVARVPPLPVVIQIYGVLLLVLAPSPVCPLSSARLRVNRTSLDTGLDKRRQLTSWPWNGL